MIINILTIIKDIIIVSFALSIAVFLLGYFVYSFKSYLQTGVPCLPSLNRNLKLLKKIKIKPNSKLLDMGCGNGKALRFFDKNFDVQAQGYEINKFDINLARLINHIKGQTNIKITNTNFQDQSIDQFDYIYLYLMPNTMKQIENRMFANISKGTTIISNTFAFPNQKPTRKIQKKQNTQFYIYKK